MNARREWGTWIAATLVLAAIVNFASVWAIPRLVMSRALARLGEANTMHVRDRVNAQSRDIVRPSPDMFYAACPYDLATGPLRVTAAVPHSTYWSIAAYDNVADNYFVEDDLQVAGNTIAVTLLRHGQPLPPLGTATEEVTLFSPSEEGLILIRLVAEGTKDIASLRLLLARSHCETVATHGAMR